MAEQTAAPFAGFTPKALQFLGDLAANNSKTWFDAHRREYEDHLLQPLKSLIAELSGWMLAIDQELLTLPGRALSRIYRDTRFSRDKSPYKTTVWITFRRQIAEWRDTPCWFFEIGADCYRYGMGYYSASHATMERLRDSIERSPAKFRHAVAFLAEQDAFALEGEKYKRTLKPDLPEDLRQWHQRKNLYLVCNRAPDEALFTRKLLDELRRDFTALAPFYDYLWRMKVSTRKG